MAKIITKHALDSSATGRSQKKPFFSRSSRFDQEMQSHEKNEGDLNFFKPGLRQGIIQRQPDSNNQNPQKRTVVRQIQIPFRYNYFEFVQLFREALGGYITFRSDNGRFLNNILARTQPHYETTLRNTHSWMLNEDRSVYSPDSSPNLEQHFAIKIFVSFRMVKDSPGEEWRTTAIAILRAQQASLLP